jgi:hypothetical protein
MALFKLLYVYLYYYILFEVGYKTFNYHNFITVNI